VQEEGREEEGSVGLNMPASAVAVSTKTANLEELKEGEYEVPFGTVIVTKTSYGYKIVIYIDEKRLGRNMANQIALSMVGPYLRREQLA